MRQPGTADSSTFGWSLDIRSKLAVFLVSIICSFLFNHPLCHLAFGLVILAAGLKARLTVGHLVAPLKPLLPILILMFVFSGGTNHSSFVKATNQEVLISFWGSINITAGGLLLGMTFVMRLINMVIMTKILLVTTPLDDFIQLCHKLKLPQSLSFIITTAIRFIPELERKKRLIMDAQRARGVDIAESSIFKGFRIRVALMIPLMINSNVMSEKLSLALLNRGFGYQNRWTELHELQLKRRDVLMFVFCLIGLGTGIGIRATSNWGLL